MIVHPPPARRQETSDLPPPLTPEQLAALPHDSLAVTLDAVVWVMNGLATIMLALRLWAKWSRGRKYWWDDLFIVAAWVLILTESGLITYCISLGMGKHTWDMDPTLISPMIKAFTFAATLSVVASIWSKTSFALTILRLTTGKTRMFVWFLLISTNIAMGFTALFNWIHCIPFERLWDLTVPGACWPYEPLVAYNYFSSAYSGVMDLCLAFIPWTLIWGMTMRRKEKIAVAIAMSMGVFAGIAAFIKTASLSAFGSLDFYDIVSTNIWTNVEVTVTIIAASIPVLRAFLKDKVSSDTTGTPRPQFFGESSFRFSMPRPRMWETNDATTSDLAPAVVTTHSEVNEKGSREAHKGDGMGCEAHRSTDSASVV